MPERSSPFLCPSWYTAAGWDGRCTVLADASGSARLRAWTLGGRGGHYFHDPVELLTGAREAGFTRDVPDLVQAVRAAAGRCVVSVSPYGYRGGAVVGAGVAEQRRALRDLADRLVAHARAQGAALLVSHYLYEDDDAAWIATLTEAGATPFVAGADCVLDVDWERLADYHRWLGPSRRSQAVESRRGGDLAWEVREEAGTSAAQRDAVRLLRAQARRFDPGAPPPDRLLEAVVDGAVLPRVLFSVGQPGAPARSVLVALRHADVLYPKFFGTSEPRADYFPLVYARVIDWAIRQGYRRVEYGGGSHEAKLLRGCRLRLGHAAMVVIDEALRPAAEKLARLVGDRKRAHFTDLARRRDVRQRRWRGS